MQVFKVDETKKKQIHKDLYKRSKITIFLYVWVVLWLVINIIWTVYTMRPDSWMLVYDSEIGLHKDWYIAWGVFAFINIIFPTLYIILRIARWRVTGRELSERINESLRLEGEILEYGYQNFAGHTSIDRVVVWIKDWDAKINGDKIIFRGKIKQKYYDDYLKMETRAPDEYVDGKWILYDYFEPALKDMLN